jgi:glutamate carboxypeptidase
MIRTMGEGLATDAMLEDLQVLVEAESFSDDLSATAVCADRVTALGARLLDGKAERVAAGERTHLLWRFGPDVRVLVIGHYDTVWPTGTLARWPFTVDGDRATGPGAFDMKAGIVQGMHAMATLPSLDGIAILLTSDEELGSPTSASLIRELASSAEATLVLEPSAGGALKTGRKGVSQYEVHIEGRAAHAGLDPEKGANALIELAHQVLQIESLANPAAGTTVTPTVARAGTASNVVPASATIAVDVRVATIPEQQRIAAAMRALKPAVAGTALRIDADENRPPLEATASADLFARAQRIASDLALGELRGVTVGGASDGNLTAAAGCPTLDGLGAVGDGAHAEGEHVLVGEMVPRAALVAALLEDLLAR